MPLPTLTLPKYKIEVPSSGKTVSYRPFIVKEEKVLLIALESGEYNMICNAVKDIVKECTFGEVDVEDSPVFDLCYLFINIRAKSVGETTEPVFLCEHCKTQNPVEINLTNIKIKNDKTHTTKIDLGDGMGIVMKYPKLDTLAEEESGNNTSIDSIVECIEMIYNGEEVFKSKDQEKKELVDFIENLTHSQFESILNFFATMPRLSHTVEFDCVKCQKKTSLELEGLGDFFL